MPSIRITYCWSQGWPFRVVCSVSHLPLVKRANNASAPSRANELFESAKGEFTGIDNEIARRGALAGLEAAMAPAHEPPPPAPAAPPA